MEMERCGSERSAGNLNMETRSGKLEYMETRESQPTHPTPDWRQPRNTPQRRLGNLNLEIGILNQHIQTWRHIQETAQMCFRENTL